MRLRTTLAAATAAALAVTGLASQSAYAEGAEVLSVDFGARTGEFRGGATGTLYGLGTKVRRRNR